jgi:hypothetical protein
MSPVTTTPSVSSRSRRSTSEASGDMAGQGATATSAEHCGSTGSMNEYGGHGPVSSTRVAAWSTSRLLASAAKASIDEPSMR